MSDLGPQSAPYRTLITLLSPSRVQVVSGPFSNRTVCRPHRLHHPSKYMPGMSDRHLTRIGRLTTLCLLVAAVVMIGLAIVGAFKGGPSPVPELASHK